MPPKRSSLRIDDLAGQHRSRIDPSSQRLTLQAIWTDCPNNQALAWEAGDQDQVARALANAAHVTRLKLINNRFDGDASRNPIGAWQL